MLEYFGDLGGLIDFCLLVGSLMITPLVMFKLDATLLQSLFDERKYDSQRHTNLNDRIKSEFKSFT